MSMNETELQPYLDAGFDLIPLHKWDKVIKDKAGEDVERGKTPIHNDWRSVRHTDKKIVAWVKKGGNLGFRLGPDDIIVDIDPKHDDACGRSAAVLESLLEIEFGIDLSDAPAVETGSGGRHVYLKKDPELKLLGKTKAFGGAIEFKCHGCQVLVAGCRHPNGEYYKWIRRGAAPAAPVELLQALYRPKPKQREPGEAVISISPAHLTTCLSYLDPEEFRVYDDWRNVLFAVHDSCDGSDEGLDAFIKWSTSDESYVDAGDSIKAIWEKATDDREGGRTARSLFWHVSQTCGGIPPAPATEDFVDDVDDGGQPAPPRRVRYERDPKGKIVANVDNVCLAITSIGLGFKFDTLANEERLMDPDRVILEKYPHLTDVTDTLIEIVCKFITAEVRTWKAEPSKETMHRAVDRLAHENPYNPLTDWLDSLTWDGVPRLDTWLIHASEAEDSAYTRAVSRLMLTSAVARAYRPGIKFDSMVILEGPQGGFKSSLLRLLGGEWTAEGMPPIKSSADKDVVSGMIGRWIIEIDELAGLRKSDVDILKGFLSRTVDRVRLPYERKSKNFKRRTVFVGTTNEGSYLRDMTGNRRFLPVYVGIINLSKVPRNQLWAEAAQQWKAKPQSVVNLPGEIWREADIQQEKRRVEDPWEEEVAIYLEKISEDRLHTETLFMEVFHKSGKDLRGDDTKRLSRVMQKLGWERTNPFRVNGIMRRGYKRPAAD